jgi:hypothetical protein
VIWVSLRLIDVSNVHDSAMETTEMSVIFRQPGPFEKHHIFLDTPYDRPSQLTVLQMVSFIFIYILISSSHFIPPARANPSTISVIIPRVLSKSCHGWSHFLSIVFVCKYCSRLQLFHFASVVPACSALNFRCHCRLWMFALVSPLSVELKML